MKVQQTLADRKIDDVHMLSITLDPENDSAQKLAEYARIYGVKPGWSFLTGNYEEIERLRYGLGVYDPDPTIDSDRSQHAGLLVYGSDALDRWSAIYSLAPPDRIVEAVDRLLERDATTP